MKRNAVTLIELLVVIAILGVLIAVAVPLISFRDQGREQREASRILTAFILKAQARAAQEQRPCGIWIERRGGNGDEAFDVALASVPQVNYTGDTTTAGCLVDGNGGNGTIGTATFGADAQFMSVVCEPGSRIQFEHKGPWFKVLTVSGNSLTFTDEYRPSPPKNPTPVILDAMGNVIGYQPPIPYKFAITLNPTNTGDRVSLPNTSTIDLTVSGSGFNPTAFNGTGPIVILFSPTGGVADAFWNDVNKRNEATGGIHLLIGRSDKVNAADPGAVDANLNDGKAIWVTINTRTGGIHTTENIPWGDTLTQADPLSAKLSCSRQLISQ